MATLRSVDEGVSFAHIIVLICTMVAAAAQYEREKPVDTSLSRSRSTCSPPALSSVHNKYPHIHIAYKYHGLYTHNV